MRTPATKAKEREQEMPTLVKVQEFHAKGWREAEDKLYRFVEKNEEVEFEAEIYVSGKFGYRFTNPAPDNKDLKYGNVR